MALSQSELHCIKNPIDFTFCDTREGKYHQKHDGNENLSGFSSPLWSKNVHSNYTCPSSPMASSMMEGRKDLMEMINTLPESCYELSLEDIVVKDPNSLVSMVKDHRVDMKLELKGKNIKGMKKSRISRSVSLDTGVFLLKTFVPSSFGSKKHKVSQSTSVDDLKKPPVDVKRWKTWLFVENNNSLSSGSCNNSTCHATPPKTRFGEGMWKFYGCLCTCKPANQKGCIFV